MISTQEELRELDTGTWLEGTEVGFVGNKDLAHTHTNRKNDGTLRSQIQKDSSRQNLEANLQDYFL